MTLARGSRRLIEDASVQIHSGWRVGVVGANGSGKSSLFALLRGELQAEAGDCEVPRDWRIEVHPTNMLGGVDDHTRQTPDAGGGKLVIKASALLGGIEIKN